MLYALFLAEKNALKNCNKGTINVLQGGGGQQSMVKDHIYFFTLPIVSLDGKRIVPCIEILNDKIFGGYFHCNGNYHISANFNYWL